MVEKKENGGGIVSSQGEVLVPLELQRVASALARLLGLAGQAVGGHLHEGAEAGMAVREFGGLRLC